MKRIAWICLTLFVGLVAYSPAQEVEIPKEIKGGVLNGKAISLPKPPYPPAARAVGASGAVTVQVLIDVNGDVESATAISGHPLLRAAAAQAAREAKFSPTRLSGQPVRVTGVITYNFVGPIYPARLGFVLAHAERTSSFPGYTEPKFVASQLSPDWIQEKEILNSLTFEPLPPVVETPVAEPAPLPPPDAKLSGQPRDTNRYTIKGHGNFSGVGVASEKRKLDAKSLSSLRQLTSLIEARMSANPSSTWAYEVGRSLGILLAEVGDSSKFASNIANLESQVNRAPSGAVNSSVSHLREFVDVYKSGSPDDENRQEFISKIEMLSNFRY